MHDIFLVPLKGRTQLSNSLVFTVLFHEKQFYSARSRWNSENQSAFGATISGTKTTSLNLSEHSEGKLNIYFYYVFACVFDFTCFIISSVYSYTYMSTNFYFFPHCLRLLLLLRLLLRLCLCLLLRVLLLLLSTVTFTNNSTYTFTSTS